MPDAARRLAVLEDGLRKIKELNWSTVHGGRERDVREQIDRLVYELLKMTADAGEGAQPRNLQALTWPPYA